MEKYLNFVEEIRNIISDILGNDYTVYVEKICKNNSHIRYGLFVKDEGVKLYPKGIEPAIYLEKWYDMYCEGKDIYNIATDIIEIYEESAKAVESFDFNMLEGSDFEKKVFYRIVNYENNKERLENVPHICFDDLAITFHCLCLEECDLVNSFMVNDAIIKKWGITTSQLFSLARKNTPVLFPERLENMYDILKNAFSEEESSKLSFEGPAMYVLTNTKGINGATAILYSKKLYDLCNELEQNMYVLPSSIHEVIVVPENMVEDTSHIQKMVKEVNRTHVLPEEVLSDSVYYYSRENRQIRLIKAQSQILWDKGFLT